MLVNPLPPRITLAAYTLCTNHSFVLISVCYVACPMPETLKTTSSRALKAFCLNVPESSHAFPQEALMVLSLTLAQIHLRICY